MPEGSDVDSITVDSTARAMLRAVRSRKIGARTLLDMHIERSRQVNDRINAVVRVDIDRARQHADQLDEMAARGRWAGPLHGLPMTIKDTFDTASMPASAGTKNLAGRARGVPDAELVQRLRRAGAVLWGKTNTPALAVGHHTSNAVYGSTRNPYEPTRTPGGSSGGSAAALAAGISPLELGSDIGGSLRIPAHFCGVYALKPTFGLLPLAGHVPPLPERPAPRDMNVAGPLARTISDLRLLLGVLADDASLGTDRPSSERGMNGARLAIWRDEAGFPLGRDCSEALTRAEKAAEELGASVWRTRPDIDSAHMFDTFTRLLLAALSSDIRREWLWVMAMLRPMARLWAAFADFGWARWLSYSTMRHAEWLEADAMRWTIKHQATDFLDRHDAILTPVAPIAAFAPKESGYYLGRRFPLDDGNAPHALFSCWSAMASLCHLPALTIPAGRNADGLPVGVQLIGQAGSEKRLLDLGEALSSSLGGFKSPEFLPRASPAKLAADRR